MSDPGVDALAEEDDLRAALRRALAVVEGSFERRAQLEHALQSRIVIEQAKGILAERLKLSLTEAFEVLRRAARSNGLKLHAVARTIVDEPETPEIVLDALPPSPVASVTDRATRIGLNESVFRSVNEQIESLADRFQLSDRMLDLVCECGNADCAERLRMSRDAYGELRADARTFAVVPGHVAPDVEDVVARREGYDVVRKHEGGAAEIAEATDPRG